MSTYILKFRASILLFLIVCTAGVWFVSDMRASDSSPYLSVSFLDVGQGDAILIQTPDGVQTLVDGGPGSSVLSALAHEIGSFDRTLDLVVGTHPDVDHIGGLVDVLERYEVSSLLITENGGESATADAYMGRIIDEGAEIMYARRGQIFVLGASTTLAVLFPETDASDMESNASSIVLRLQYGDTSFLLTGDSPKRIEEYLVLAEGEHLQSNVLKVGHHGSRTSSSKLFLDEVAPQYAVISAGENNRYGHPHVEVTDALFNRRIQTLQTAQEGTITFLSDGSSVWIK